MKCDFHLRHSFSLDAIFSQRQKQCLPKRACKQFHTVRAVLTFLKCPSAIAGWCYCCRVLLRWTDTQSVQSQTFLRCPSAIAAECYCGGLAVCAIPLYAHFPTLETANYILSPPAVPICQAWVFPQSLIASTFPHQGPACRVHILSFEGTLCLNYKIRFMVNVLCMRISLESLKGSRSSHSLSKGACLLYTSQVSGKRA